MSANKSGDELRKVGFDTEHTLDRAGSFLVENNDVAESFQTAESQRDFEILPIAEALKKYKDVRDRLFTVVPKDKDENTLAVAEEAEPAGYFIRIKKGRSLVFPIQSCFYIKTPKFKQKVHNIIVAEEGSEAHIITGCTTSEDASDANHIGITEFFVEKNAKLSYTMVHNWGPDVAVMPSSAARVDDGGLFMSNYVSLGKVGKIKMFPKAYLGAGAIGRFYSIIYAPTGGDYDVGSAVFLNGEGASGDIISRVVSDGGKVISRGLISATKPGTTGHMECSGLMLADTGIIHAVPELSGAIMDTTLSHEAAVGKISDEEVNYLKTRGLSEEEATSLIISGFLDLKMEGLPEALQATIDELVQKSLSGTSS